MYYLYNVSYTIIKKKKKTVHGQNNLKLTNLKYLFINSKNIYVQMIIIILYIFSSILFKIYMLLLK